MSESTRSYLIIGASSDIGMVLIKNLANKADANIIIIAHYRNKNNAFVELENNLAANSLVDLRTIQADLSSSDGIRNLIESIENEHIGISYIVHLPAQKFSYSRIKQLDWLSVQKDMEIQVHSLVELFRIFLPEMSKRKYGKIVLTLSSIIYNTPPKYLTHYLIVKYALLGLMKGAAVEYAEKGININAISPGMIETKFLENIDTRIPEINAEKSLIKRNIRIEDVVSGIEFLLSDLSNAMHGVNLNLSAGEYM
jgi:3-oxoacyl-[acyl-carrier protein] reductase